MAEDIHDKYLKAGRVNAAAGDFARTLVKPGASVREIANNIEQFIKEKGVALSFPVNLSLDDCAAHYSPSIDDDFVLPPEGLLKIDIGTHVDGYIADHAITVDIGGSGGVHQ
nr:M24 family metallopeptidase [Candidatus Sigynarchaeota archaeon]